MALTNEQFVGLFCMGWIGIAYIVGLINDYFHKKEGYYVQTRLLMLGGKEIENESETALKSAMFLSMED